MSKRYSGKSFKDRSVMKKPKLTLIFCVQKTSPSKIIPFLKLVLLPASTEVTNKIKNRTKIP